MYTFFKPPIPDLHIVSMKLHEIFPAGVIYQCNMPQWQGPVSCSPGGLLKPPPPHQAWERQRSPLFFPHEQRSNTPEHNNTFLNTSPNFNLYMLAVGKRIKYHQTGFGYLIFDNFMCQLVIGMLSLSHQNLSLNF